MRQAIEAVALLGVAAGALGAQTGAPPIPGSISGRVVDARTNLALAGVFVTGKYSGLPPLARTVKSGADGAFSLAALPAGAYSVCVQAPGGGYLDPCQWVTATPGRAAAPTAVVVVGSGQQVTGQVVRVQPGSVLRVRVNDPSRLLSQRTRDGREQHLLIGVWGPDRLFYPMWRASQDAAGATYQLTVPVGTPLRFAIASRTLRLADEGGAAVPAAGAAVDFQNRSGEANPRSFLYTVTGVLP